MLDGFPESETPGMYGNSMHGNQEIRVALAALRKRRAGRGTQKGTPSMYAAGKSDYCVVPEKVPNKGESLRRNWREGSGSRRTPWKNTRTGHRTGKPCQGDCQACGKPLKRGFAPNIRDKSRVR